jgi:hypothetical protein
MSSCRAQQLRRAIARSQAPDRAAWTNEPPVASEPLRLCVSVASTRSPSRCGCRRPGRREGHRNLHNPTVESADLGAKSRCPPRDHLVPHLGDGRDGLRPRSSPRTVNPKSTIWLPRRWDPPPERWMVRAWPGGAAPASESTKWFPVTVTTSAIRSGWSANRARTRRGGTGTHRSRRGRSSRRACSAWRRTG